MRYNTEERAGRSVLLVIDVQDRYIGRYEAGLVERINRRIADAVAATALDGVRLGYRVRLGMACVGTVSERRYERKLQQMTAAGIELEG